MATQKENAKKSVKATKPHAKPPPRNVSPDSIDFRDRVYLPAVDRAPVAALDPPPAPFRPILHQLSTDACTGFALATLVHVLTGRRDTAPRQRGGKAALMSVSPVSPFMLYGMARRYDDLPGTKPTDGSTCRGVLKGWFKHGVCAAPLWSGLPEPKPKTGVDDWWDEAVKRPLGAYYRVEPRSIVDMQVALNEVGVLLASADTHDGWDEGDNAKPPGKRKGKNGAGANLWTIPYESGAPSEGGHAFAIVGYSQSGFIVQNSWGTGWGSGGLAILTYNDWRANGYDCWVAQLGVVTDLHKATAQGGVPQHRALTATHAGVLDIHALSPYVINTANDGELSESGDFHTREEDIKEMCNKLMPEHRAEWKIPAGQPLDVALYAHGGLVDEKAAARTASKWIPLLKQAKVFPVFFMWESGLIETILNEIKDPFRERGDIPTGGLLDRVDQWWSDRIEGVARLVGKNRWGEMKENARLLTEHPEGKGGARLLADCLQSLQGQIRLHLIGHSAGAVIHAYLAQMLSKRGWQIESLSLMAPALRFELFLNTLVPLMQNGTIGRTAQFHLNDATEDDESGMRMALGYKRSLLYMISNGLEEKRQVRVVGMEKFFNDHVLPLGLPNLQFRVAPGSTATRATKHGSFDDDGTTQQSVVAHVLGKPISA